MKNRKKIIAFVAFAFLIGLFPVLRQKIQSADAELEGDAQELGALAIMQENSLAQISSPKNPDLKVARVFTGAITGYSSTPWQTDDTPFVTAAGTSVRNGVVANNLLPFGTKIRIPSLFGDKIFIVEDRMNSRMSSYQFDVWFANTKDALIFGVKTAKIEILER